MIRKREYGWTYNAKDDSFPIYFNSGSTFDIYTVLFFQMLVRKLQIPLKFINSYPLRTHLLM